MKGRLMRALGVLGLALCFCLSLWGCSRGLSGEQQTLEPGEYWIYYLDSTAVRLSPQPYRPAAQTPQELVAELMEQFQRVPADVDCQPAMTDQVTYLDARFEDQVLYLYFDTNYTAMKPEREILCRAALTRMLTQIEGVEYINIYCGDQPLMDKNGNPVGMLANSDFIMSTSNVNSYEKADLTLYFTDETGTRLVKETRSVFHSINTSKEQLIVEQLIAGPESENHYATLPSDVKILNFTVNNNVCYINFDSAFTDTNLNVNEYIPIYSIVNSLSEDNRAMKVRIMVNGSQEVLFRDLVSLNTTFERNEELMESP